MFSANKVTVKFGPTGVVVANKLASKEIVSPRLYPVPIEFIVTDKVLPLVWSIKTLKVAPEPDPLVFVACIFVLFLGGENPPEGSTSGKFVCVVILIVDPDTKSLALYW